MQFSITILALVASSIASVSAVGNAHSNLHKRVHARELAPRDIAINSKINLLSAVSNFAAAVEGAVSSMPYQNHIVNNGTQDAKIAFWSGENFALPKTAYNANPPQPNLIVDLPAGTTKTVSFSNSYNGAYAAIYPGTGIQAGGGINGAWVEITTGDFATVDVSFLPNMNDKLASVVSGGCVSDWTKCSFKCNDGSSSCWTAPVSELIDCSANAPGSYKFDAGSSGAGPWNGGCNIASEFTTTFYDPSQ